MEVAVIGAGLAGICALRHLTAVKSSEIKKVVAFEQGPAIGGLWCYTDKTGKDENGIPVHTSAYRDLHANDPKEIGTIEDFDHLHPSPPGCFLKWDAVLQYLQEYVEHFQLGKYIQLNTRVERVHPEIQDGGSHKWSVQVCRMNSRDKNVDQYWFDAVIVCNGQFSVPLMPDIQGLSSFKGPVVHSHDFRVPEPFQGQTVLVVGAAASGTDIGMIIAEHANQVYLSSRNPYVHDSSTLPERMDVVTTIKLVKAQSVVLDDGQELAVDAIVLCTGYNYSFPFLSDACRPTIDRQRLFPLYKHMVHVDYPTLIFIGVCKTVPAFKFFPVQAQFATAVLLGKVQLPSKEDMLADIEKDYRGRLAMGLSHNKAHSLFPARTLLKSYQDGLLALEKDKAYINPIPERYLEFFTHQGTVLFTAPEYYRTSHFPQDTDWSKIPRRLYPCYEP